MTQTNKQHVGYFTTSFDHSTVQLQTNTGQTVLTFRSDNRHSSTKLLLWLIFKQIVVFPQHTFLLSS